VREEWRRAAASSAGTLYRHSKNCAKISRCYYRFTRMQHGGAPPPHVALLDAAPPALPRRVSVARAFAIKEHLKALSYRFDASTSAWWTPFETVDTLEALKVRRRQRGIGAELAARQSPDKAALRRER
jgi:hypothetical protein